MISIRVCLLPYSLFQWFSVAHKWSTSGWYRICVGSNRLSFGDAFYSMLFRLTRVKRFLYNSCETFRTSASRSKSNADKLQSSDSRYPARYTTQEGCSAWSSASGPICVAPCVRPSASAKSSASSSFITGIICWFIACKTWHYSTTRAIRL